MTDTSSKLKFWEDFKMYAEQDGVEVYINTKSGGPPFKVWPRFYINEIENSSKLRPRIAYSGEEHVALYFMNVKFDDSFTFDDFHKVIQPMLGNGMCIGDPPEQWPSVKIKVPYVNVEIPAEEQIEKLKEVFEAARRLRGFYIQYQQELLQKIPTTT
jgi:hypothetical protein